MHLNPLSLLLIGSSIISLFLSIHAWKRRKNTAVKPLCYLMAATFLWSFAYGLEVAAHTLGMMKTLSIIAYVGIAAIPVLWLIFATQYSGNDGWLTRRGVTGLFLIPSLTLTMIATNDLHHLFYAVTELGVFHGLTFQKLQPGPFWWVHVIYSYLAVISGIALLVRMFFKVARVHRIQIGFFLVGAIWPYLVNFSYVAGFKPYGFLDLTPIAFVGMGVILSIGLFAARLFDITPLALDMLFNHIPDAIFVLDTHARVVNANPAGRSLESAKFFMADDDSIPLEDIFSREYPEKKDLTMGDKVYDMTRTPIHSPAGRHLGTLIVMRDITERQRVAADRTQTIDKLRSALAEIKTLRGIVPICASCKKIRDDKGYWQQVEAYVSEHTEAQFSHGICPECMARLYPDFHQNDAVNSENMDTPDLPGGNA